LEIGRSQLLASLGTDECGEQDEVDVQIMSVLQMQACIWYAVARIERQRKSLDGPRGFIRRRRIYRPSQRRYSSWEIPNWSRSLPTVWLSRSSMVLGW